MIKSSFNDNNVDRLESGLAPICPNCGDSLVAIIGTEIVISPRCNKEFQLISVERMKRGISKSRINRETTPYKSHAEYLCGFIGGIKWTKQQERYQ